MKCCTQFSDDRASCVALDTIENQKEAFANYNALKADILAWLSEGGGLVSNMERIMAKFTLCEYVMVPLNMLLWLARRGMSEEDAARLYRGLAWKCLVEAGLERRKRLQGLALSEMPITRRMKELLRHRELFDKPVYRNYGQLMGLFCVLGCLGYRMWENANYLVQGILDEYALDATEYGLVGRVYEARYDHSLENGWNICIVKAEKPDVAVEKLLRFSKRAEKRLLGNHGIGISYENRNEWLAKFMAIMATGCSHSAKGALEYGFLTGEYILWQ